MQTILAVVFLIVTAASATAYAVRPVAAPRVVARRGAAVIYPCFPRPPQLRRQRRLESKAKVAQLLYELEAARNPKSEEACNRLVEYGAACAKLRGL